MEAFAFTMAYVMLMAVMPGLWRSAERVERE